ncbi:hypothetical protein D9M71_778800 [compost metagenome]
MVFSGDFASSLKMAVASKPINDRKVKANMAPMPGENSALGVSGARVRPSGPPPLTMIAVATMARITHSAASATPRMFALNVMFRKPSTVTPMIAPATSNGQGTSIPVKSLSTDCAKTAKAP